MPSCSHGWAPGAFSDDDLRLVQVLADQAAVALENARSLASRDRLVQELEALLQISRAGSTEHDEAALAGLVADILVRTSGADACVVSRWDEASAELEMLSWKGRLDCGQAGLRGDLARFPLDAAGPAGRASRSWCAATGPVPRPPRPRCSDGWARHRRCCCR